MTNSTIDNAGNSIATARNVTVLPTVTTFADSVGIFVFDINDYYRFTLAGASDFNLSLTGLSADADVELLNGTGGFIASSTAGGATNESIVRQLAAGTYLV